MAACRGNRDDAAAAAAAAAAAKHHHHHHHRHSPHLLLILRQFVLDVGADVVRNNARPAACNDKN